MNEFNAEQIEAESEAAIAVIQSRQRFFRLFSISKPTENHLLGDVPQKNFKKITTAINIVEDITRSLNGKDSEDFRNFAPLVATPTKKTEALKEFLIARPHLVKTINKNIDDINSLSTKEIEPESSEVRSNEVSSISAYIRLHQAITQACKRYKQSLGFLKRLIQFFTRNPGKARCEDVKKALNNATPCKGKPNDITKLLEASNVRKKGSLSHFIHKEIQAEFPTLHANIEALDLTANQTALSAWTQEYSNGLPENLIYQKPALSKNVTINDDDPVTLKLDEDFRKKLVSVFRNSAVRYSKEKTGRREYLAPNVAINYLIGEKFFLKYIQTLPKSINATALTKIFRDFLTLSPESSYPFIDDELHKAFDIRLDTLVDWLNSGNLATQLIQRGSFLVSKHTHTPTPKKVKKQPKTAQVPPAPQQGNVKADKEEESSAQVPPAPQQDNATADKGESEEGSAITYTSLLKELGEHIKNSSVAPTALAPEIDKAPVEVKEELKEALQAICQKIQTDNMGAIKQLLLGIHCEFTQAVKNTEIELDQLKADLLNKIINQFPNLKGQRINSNTDIANIIEEIPRWLPPFQNEDDLTEENVTQLINVLTDAKGACNNKTENPNKEETLQNVQTEIDTIIALASTIKAKESNDISKAINAFNREVNTKFLDLNNKKHLTEREIVTESNNLLKDAKKNRIFDLQQAKNIEEKISEKLTLFSQQQDTAKEEEALLKELNDLQKTYLNRDDDASIADFFKQFEQKFPAVSIKKTKIPVYEKYYVRERFNTELTGKFGPSASLDRCVNWSNHSPSEVNKNLKEGLELQLAKEQKEKQEAAEEKTTTATPENRVTTFFSAAKNAARSKLTRTAKDTAKENAVEKNTAKENVIEETVVGEEAAEEKTTTAAPNRVTAFFGAAKNAARSKPTRTAENAAAAKETAEEKDTSQQQPSSRFQKLRKAAPKLPTSWLPENLLF